MIGCEAGGKQLELSVTGKLMEAGGVTGTKVNLLVSHVCVCAVVPPL